MSSAENLVFAAADGHDPSPAAPSRNSTIDSW